MHLPNVDAHDFVAGRSGLKAIFRRKYDVFHIHWLERAFWRGGRIAVLKAVAATLCAAALLKLRGASIIWTAHDPVPHDMKGHAIFRSEEHTSELQSLMRISYAVFCLKNKTPIKENQPYS